MKHFLAMTVFVVGIGIGAGMTTHSALAESVVGDRSTMHSGQVSPDVIAAVVESVLDNESPDVIAAVVESVINNESSAIAEAIRERTENQFWLAVRESNDVRDFKAYLERYPNGGFTSVALRSVEQYEKLHITRENSRENGREFLMWIIAVIALAYMFYAVPFVVFPWFKRHGKIWKSRLYNS